MNAHLPTLFLVVILIGVIMTLAVSAAATDQNNDGLRPVAQGLALTTAGYILFSQRGEVSDVLTVFLANVLLAASLSTYTVGLYQFQKRQLPKMAVWLPVLLIGLVTISLINYPVVRATLGSLILSAQVTFLLLALLSKRKETVGLGQYYLIVSFSLFLAIFVARWLAPIFGFADSLSINATGTLQSLSLLTPVVCITLIAMGFIVMGKERSDERNLRLAMQDELTGLANRRHVLDVLAQQLAAVTRANLPLSLLMLDIDHFKQINDSYGHPAGDQVLRQVASCLRSRLRAQDVAGRVGGEEFLVVLPQTSLEGALGLAEALRASIEQLPIDTADGQRILVTISVGVSTLEVVPEPVGASLIAAADAALYRAKHNGRNRVEHQSIRGPAEPLID